MDYLITLLLTILIVAAVVFLLTRVRTPRYRLSRENVVTLLRMVLDGTATVHDWNVFVGIPIRHDPDLEAVRLRCQRIEAREMIGGTGAGPGRRRLFTDQGLAELRALLAELEAGSER